MRGNSPLGFQSCFPNLIRNRVVTGIGHSRLRVRRSCSVVDSEQRRCRTTESRPGWLCDRRLNPKSGAVAFEGLPTPCELIPYFVPGFPVGPLETSARSNGRPLAGILSSRTRCLPAAFFRDAAPGACAVVFS